MKNNKKIAALVLAASMSLGALAGCAGGELEERPGGFTDGFTMTAATDDAGRAFSPVSGYEQDKYVGIFYFLWNGSDQSPIKDVSNNYEKNHTVMTELLARQANGGTQEMNAFHYWGQPLYGYYNADDEWVIRKHIELFIHAGLDFVAFDTSNGRIYDVQAYAFLDLLLEYYEQGFDVPKVMFLTSVDPATSRTSVEQIYNTFYDPDLYPEYEPLWFRGTQNKPWIIGSTTGNSIIDSSFYFKLPQWPNAAIESARFPWMDWNYPQDIYTDPQVGNIMSVSVSQHVGIAATSKPLADFSDSGLFAPENRSELQKNGFQFDTNYMDLVYNANWGRGYDHATGTNSRERALAEGTNFEQQWDTVFNNAADGDSGNDIDLVFVTGWNEWVAQKQPNSSILGDDYCHFVDTFNMEFSRDIEMNAEYLDNYYLSLIRNVREYKGEGEGKTFAESTGSLASLMTRLDGWNDESVAVFRDFTGETIARSALDTSGQTVLENDTGRNDITEVRVTADQDAVYLLVRTADAITAHEEGDERWMNVYLGAEGSTDGWMGMQYVLNRAPGNGTTSLHRIGKDGFTLVGSCEYSVEGNVMRIRVERSMIGLPVGQSLGIKVADNLQKDLDISEFYVNGDAAPIGRMRYVYKVTG